jgi:ribosomal protein S27E
MSKLVSELALSTTYVKPKGTGIMACIECKSTDILFDPGMGEQVCAGCGVILAERLSLWRRGKLIRSIKCKIFRTSVSLLV